MLQILFRVNGIIRRQTWISIYGAVARRLLLATGKSLRLAYHMQIAL